ncbi:MAG: hypothetical protein HPY85_15625 [Anaerolineae bacterium]|nr:hypothetical protein [Anaerolineae bacterium]
MEQPPDSHIGTLNEGSLHAALKQTLRQPGDMLEVKVDGSFIDIVRGETLIEIQTRSFASMRRKLDKLLALGHPIRLYHPVALRKWIVREDRQGTFLSRRKSPRKGSAFDVFDELLSLRDAAAHSNFALHLLLVEVEEVWRNDGKGSWRKKYWSVVDHRLLRVAEEVVFRTPRDYLALLPAALLEQPFTNADLAKAAGCGRRLAGKTTYALQAMGVLQRVGTRQRYHLFAVEPGEETEKG